MVETQNIPMEEVNSILFPDEESDSINSEPYSTPTQETENFQQPQLINPEQRLLKQRGLKEFTLEKIPYYKRPVVQFAFVAAIGFPIAWLFLAAFNPGSNAQPLQAEDSPLEQENQQLKASLDEARQKIDDMTFSEGLEQQEIELIQPVEEETKETPPPKPAPPPKIAKVQQPSRPVPVARPVVYRQVKSTVPKQQVIKKIEPEIDPMEQWLAQANRGYSVSSLEKVPYRSVASSSTSSKTQQYSYGSNSEIEVATEQSEQLEVKETSEQLPSSTEVDAIEAVPVQETASKPSSTNPRQLLANSRLEQLKTQEIPWDNSQFRARLDIGRNALSNKAKLIANRSNSASIPEKRIPTSKKNRFEPRTTKKEVETPIANKNKLLDIGAYAEATLGEAIAWTREDSKSNQKYVLYLEKGFKNSGGIEVLPPGTRLIASIPKTSSSGLFFMEVNQIVMDWSKPKIDLNPGTFKIVAKDGSPLKAKLQQKRSNGFWTNAGAIVAPGISNALDTADNILLDDDDNYYINSNSDPLASGISGIADGASNVLNNRMRSRSQGAVSYFQFDKQTVRVVVNEDILLP